VLLKMLSNYMYHTVEGKRLLPFEFFKLLALVKNVLNKYICRSHIKYHSQLIFLWSNCRHHKAGSQKY